MESTLVPVWHKEAYIIEHNTQMTLVSFLKSSKHVAMPIISKFHLFQ